MAAKLLGATPTIANARRGMGELAGANDAIHLALRRWTDGTEGAAIEAEAMLRAAAQGSSWTWAWTPRSRS